MYVSGKLVYSVELTLLHEEYKSNELCITNCPYLFDSSVEIILKIEDKDNKERLNMLLVS